jgi:hypothetical protein
MKKKKVWLKPWLIVGLALGGVLYFLGCAEGAGNDESSPTGENATLNGAGQAMSESYLPGSLKGQNLIQFHRTAGKQDNQLCITCHGDKKDETATYDSKILQPHSIKMMKGIKCIHCHRSVDLLEGSGAKLRKQVATSICADCHGSNLFPGLK